ncbi:hypothetical protein LCGC14_0742960 [marine sediment metagenome]|uniref:Uncharacterized protein n=1 Tax=marine sediment metagenome TaxID=412755 RepID=A0A0F9SR99_9ZZZZ
MNNMIEELIMLSDIFDFSGFNKEATQIDKIIKAAGPQSGAVTQFIDALKEKLKSVSAQEGFPTISDKSLPEIFSVIDNLVEKGTFLEYKILPEEYAQYKEEQAESLKVASHMLTLEDDIQKMQDRIEQTLDPEELNTLNYNIKADMKELEELHQKVKQWQTGKRDEDQSLYAQFKERYNSRRGQEVF